LSTFTSSAVICTLLISAFVRSIKTRVWVVSDHPFRVIAEPRGRHAPTASGPSYRYRFEALSDRRCAQV
jgi:hypothetical protein